VARLAGSGKENCGFIQFLPMPLNHWHERVSDEILMAARKLLALGWSRKRPSAPPRGA